MQAYSDPNRKNDPHALPDIEIFFNDSFVDDDGERLGNGFYYWHCFPGCLPDSEPIGPFASEDSALADAEENSPHWEGDDHENT